MYLIHVYMYMYVHCIALYCTVHVLPRIFGIVGGCVLGGINNHIKLHLLQDQREFCSPNTGENTSTHVHVYTAYYMA